MKTFRQAITGAVVLSFASAIHTFAIEGLQISVQSSNVVLSWPSTNSETYLVQYRPTLNPSDSWQTLTDSLAAATGTNVTCFVHSNIVQYPPAGSGGATNGGSVALPDADAVVGGQSAPLSSAAAAPGLMVMPLDGSGSAVPLALYPPGFDFSSFDIFDPNTGASVSGGDYSANLTISAMQADDLQPLDGFNGGTSPVPNTGFYQVVRDGVHIYGLANGAVLSGTVQFPIEFAVGSTDQIVGVAFYDTNDNPIIGASAQGTGNTWTMTWNTPMSFNGNYNVCAELDFATNSPAISLPVAVTVSNVISFPNYFSQTFGSQMWIYAQTLPNAQYEIDMYGENTNYLGSFMDYADNGGYISFIWNLTDYNGNPSSSTNFYGVFTVNTSSLQAMPAGFQAQNNMTNSTTSFKESVTNASGNGFQPNAGSPSASATQLWVKEPAWTPNNNWVVGYGSLTGDSSVDSSVQYMIAGGLSSPTEDGGVLGTLDPYGLNGNLSPGNNAQNGNVFALHDPTTRSNLLSYLADFRYENFYFFGHGNESCISAYAHSGTVITHDDITYALLNVPLSWSIIHAAEHPYRFIWIDACDTGKGSFCEAFAVPAITVSTNVFAAVGVESRAFLGFTKPVNFDPSNSSGDVNGWPSRSTMIGDFLSAWIHNQTDLQTLVYDAQNGLFENYPIYKMDRSAVIYGAYDLTWNIRTRP